MNTMVVKDVVDGQEFLEVYFFSHKKGCLITHKYILLSYFKKQHMHACLQITVYIYIYI